MSNASEFNALAQYKGKVVVLKVGGKMLGNESIYQIAVQVLELLKHGAKPIIVHGGAPYIDTALINKSLPIKQDRETGIRITCEKTIEVADHALIEVNKRITAIFNFCVSGTCKYKFQGISGYDYDLVLAKKEATHFGGCATSVNAELLQKYLDKNIVPVINPICRNEDLKFDGDFRINTNGDDNARIIAQTMGSKKNPAELVLLSDSCVLDKEGNPINILDAKRIKTLKADLTITEGMIVKVDEALKAAKLKNISGVHIINGAGIALKNEEHNNQILKSLCGRASRSTLIRP